jgi:hypothetical protein
MITVIQFPKTTSRALRFLYGAIVRQRVNTAANRLKLRYAARNLTADPRQDVHVVADFDGQTAAQLGLQDPSTFKLMVVAANGTLIREWTTVPTTQDLDSALR